MIALSGIAGTGKTFIALLSGLYQVLKSGRLYDKVVVARPAIASGPDIGYFPGDKEDKLSEWMNPIFDNLFAIIKNSNQRIEEGFSRKNAQRKKENLFSRESLISQGTLELESVAHIRGRSLQRTFIIIDEAQNLRPWEMKTIITRCGEGTKIVFCGDLEQIDTPYLDSNSSGLAYLIDRFKDDEAFCYLKLKRASRSRLAEKATRLL